MSNTIIAVCFGVLGFALIRAHIPMVHIILGLVLGPIMERYFRQGLGAAGGDLSVFVTRPLILKRDGVWKIISKTFATFWSQEGRQ